MSIWGIGIDLCEISRVERSLEKHGEKFAEKILGPDEMDKFRRHRFPGRFLAKRFAAKEAFAKALGTGIAENVTLPSIQVKNDDRGKPELILCDGALDRFLKFGCKRTHLSISDEKQMAIAQVLIEN
ncbi:holo-ACP synthase [Aliikangiella sp. G2MR2-5]|uniref:holo-ACP synthase n=1 Tax=Aliikangiella sp. G2MR2-5 TaxID=2788943 RepID=UPI0018AA7FDF|nr:holo-ACP synthase [Aliikangiella sp. G2MR2-5]